MGALELCVAEGTFDRAYQEDVWQKTRMENSYQQFAQDEDSDGEDEEEENDQEGEDEWADWNPDQCQVSPSDLTQSGGLIDPCQTCQEKGVYHGWSHEVEAMPRFKSYVETAEAILSEAAVGGFQPATPAKLSEPKDDVPLVTPVKASKGNDSFPSVTPMKVPEPNTPPTASCSAPAGTTSDWEVKSLDGSRFQSVHGQATHGDAQATFPPVPEILFPVGSPAPPRRTSSRSGSLPAQESETPVQLTIASPRSTAQESHDETRTPAPGSPVTPSSGIQWTKKEGRWRPVKGLMDTVRTSLQQYWAQGSHKEDASVSEDDEMGGCALIDDLELMALQAKDLQALAPEAYGLEEGPEATVDSGASHPVADAQKHFPGSKVVPSVWSKQGLVYKGAGDEKLRNRGEFQVRMMTQEGTVCSTTWQDAGVRKPLLAVSACEDKGNLTVFDQEGSYIISKEAPELEQIRELLRRATKKVTIQRKSGIYTMRTWQVPQGFKPSQLFPRRGS